ncbi:MAG: type II toxin-antitoxin system HicB family antitoxin [FCB group bacterium]|jgi:predicted HicB family RNase H-like nuclease
MKDIIKYKEFIVSAHYSDDDEIFFGKIEGIDDLVTYEGSTVTNLKKAFEEAVNDYIQLCEDTGKLPKKSYNGSFNVRIPPHLHKIVAEKAISYGIPLNKLVQQALEKEVESKVK